MVPTVGHILAAVVVAVAEARGHHALKRLGTPWNLLSWKDRIGKTGDAAPCRDYKSL